MTSIAVDDRLEIQDLLVRYCHALDDRDWAAFEQLFAADAVVDFSAFGGPRCSAPAMAEFLRGIATQVPGWQHTISTLLLSVDGDRIRSRCAAQVMMITKRDDGGDRVNFNGLWYRDTLVRTPQGWRIAERIQQRSWVHDTGA
jgi:3-phenylpropionate/cinnamic acid dioxygenase small subunit